ncbi:SDR family NAD(P)-dependent oxidoreductase [Limnohabitans sp.]|jgi:NAD(P)-dependent dehydrogenase (short-subunit alcohol dehydrogenase family)|uniref:SDR family NAD(P)-dependent oxidoreductase n=1 Tax=Limnohabitans sp. TaxID=1907725 RepID=UPI0037C02C10
MKLAGRTALVTGGATGLGRAFVQRLLEDGARVVIGDLRGADVAAAEEDSTGKCCFGVTMDVTDEASVADAVKAIDARFAGVDILINNAALFSTLENRPFEDYSSDEWMQVMRVNTLGPFICAKAVAPHMKAQQWGRIINVASTSALKGLSNMAHYVTSKGAVITFTRVLARELGAWNITANALAPGLTLSDQILKNDDHMAKFGEAIRKSRSIQRDALPADLVGTVSFLASDDAAFMTGQTLCVEGGAIFV